MYQFVGPVLIIVTFYLIYKYLYDLDYWKKKNVPYVKPHWLFGNYKDFVLTKGNVKTFQDVYHAHDNEKLVGSFRAFVPELIIRDPDLIKNVLITDFNHFPDRYISDEVDYEVEAAGESLLVYPAKKWKPVRQKLTPAFTPNKLKNMFPLVKETCDNLVKYIEEREINSNAVDIIDLMSRYTSDVIGSIGFGISVNSIYDPEAPFRKIAKQLVTIDYAKFIRYTIRISIGKLANKFRLRMFPKSVENFFLDSVQSIIEERMKSNEKRPDFIQIFMEMMEREKLDVLSSNTKESIEVNYRFITAQAITFFLAGYETSALTMAYMLHELAYHQDIQEKVYQEIVSVLNETDGVLTHDSMNNMTYFDMALRESMRKNPVILCMARYCSMPYTFPGTNISLNKGEMVSIPLMCMQLDPKYYPEPEKFIPERFSPEERKNRHQMVYIPFGEGPKICIGKRLAGIQSKAGLISVILNYKVEPCFKSKYEIERCAPLTLVTSKDGVWLKFSKR